MDIKTYAELSDETRNLILDYLKENKNTQNQNPTQNILNETSETTLGESTQNTQIPKQLTNPDKIKQILEEHRKVMENSQKSKRYKEQAKQRRKEERREFIKDKVKFLVKLGAGLAGTGTLIEVVTIGTNYYDAYCNDRLDFEEREYYKNPNVDAGYYNEHPITLNISNKIDEKYKDTMIKAFNKFDKAAEGLSFEITYADPKTTKADINVYPDKSDSSWLAYATLGDLDDKRIKGSINVDLDKTPPYLLGALMQHELGHVVGLAHSKNPHDIMFPNAGTKFSLSRNDIKRINTIYPKEFEKENVSVSYLVVPNHYLSNTTQETKKDDELTF